MHKAKTDTAAAQQELVIDAAQMYVLSKKNIDATADVTSTELMTAGYLEAKDYKKAIRQLFIQLTKTLQAEQ